MRISINERVRRIFSDGDAEDQRDCGGHRCWHLNGCFPCRTTMQMNALAVDVSRDTANELEACHKLNTKSDRFVFFVGGVSAGIFFTMLIFRVAAWLLH